MKNKMSFAVVVFFLAALKLFSQADQPSTLNEKTLDFIRLAKYTEAIEYLNKNLALNPKLSDGYNLKAWTYCYMNEYAKAIPEANTGLAMAPTHYSYDTRATAYALNGEFEKSIADFDKAITLSAVPLYIYKRGLVKLALNDVAAAEIDFVRAKTYDKYENYLKENDPIFLKFAYKYPLHFFVKKLVEEKITAWQQKGEFEKTVDYQKRVTEVSRNQMVQTYTNEAIELLKQDYTKNIKWNLLSLSQYDADNETYLIKVNEIANFAMPVPFDKALAFKQNWSTLQFSGQDYFVINNRLELAKLTITDTKTGEIYTYNSKQNTTYLSNNISYNFKPIEINISQNNQSNNTTISENNNAYGIADVDTNIPLNEPNNTTTFAVIIANENYTREVKVQYAANDGKIFKEYCEKTLGIPSKNIHFAQDATFGTMKSEIKWISDVAAAYNGKAKLIFYYAGHGMPNEADKSTYLLPVDGFSTDFETAIGLTELYNRLTQNPAISVTVFLDACFSGSIRDNGMLANARAVKVKPAGTVIKGNMVVFSAASGDETAYPYKEKQHGLFTYFLLKKLQNTKGDVDFITLSDFITENVKQQSVVVNQKSQTPQVNASSTLQETWKTWKLK